MSLVLVISGCAIVILSANMLPQNGVGKREMFRITFVGFLLILLAALIKYFLGW